MSIAGCTCGSDADMWAEHDSECRGRIRAEILPPANAETSYADQARKFQQAVRDIADQQAELEDSGRVRFVQIAAGSYVIKNKAVCDIFGLDSYGRVWRYVQAKGGWIVLTDEMA